MFPNVRLMIVAVLASVVAIGCGLGMFAAFRVNHEPFVRVQNGSSPLQLLFDSAAPAAAVTETTATPFSIRFQVIAPPTGGGAANMATAKLERAGVDATTDVSAIAPAREPVMTPSSSDHASSDHAAADKPASAAGPGAGQETIQETKQETKQEAKQETKQVTEHDGTGDVAVATPADQSPPADQTVQDTKTAPASAISPGAKTTAKTARKLVRRHRLAKVRRFRKPQTGTGAQSTDRNFTFSQPNFQSAPQAADQAPQTGQRRVAGSGTAR